MEADQSRGSTQEIGFSSRYLEKFKVKMIEVMKKVKKIGEDDPRRIIHSFKFALALTLVSIFYYVTPLYASFGVSAMWAVLTVVVVMEFTVGGTLGKGLNRAVGTLVAGALGIGAHYISSLCGHKGEPIVLGILVFVLAAIATYSRFIPEIKARYDYGVIVFILTFSLVAISSYRVDALTQFAHQRLSTIAIGVSICVFCSISLFPVWAGEDLQDLVATNLEKLGTFLKGMGEEHYWENVGNGSLEGMSFLKDYKSVLNSRPTEESLANFARWEPGHGRFGFCHPWRQYLKIGALARKCAYSMEVLQNYISTSGKTKAAMITTTESELSIKIRSACIDMSNESSNALKELASSIRTMTTPSSGVINPHIDATITSTIKLKAHLSYQETRSTTTVSSALESVIIATLLVDIVDYVHQITIAVQELARLAHFKSLEPIHRATIKPLIDGERPELVNIIVEV